MHFRFEHDFDIDAKDYWDLFFDAGYTADMYTATKMKDHKVLEQKDDGRVLRRTVKLTPAVEIPSAFRAVIKDMGYTEHDVFHRERSEMEVSIEPTMLKDKFQLKAIYAVKPLGPGRCRRSFEGDAKISIMLIGGQIEKFMVEETRRSYEIAADVTRRWIAKRKSAT